MDPERPIEKLLRKAAKARRAQAGAPQELHQANRRMLQGEVARRFAAAPQKRSFLDSLSLLMPRLAWGAAVLVGVGLAASLMLPRRNTAPKDMFLAKNERALSLQTAKEAKLPGAGPAEPSALSETLARTRADEAGRTATAPELAQADREKDSLGVERRKADSQSRLTLNAPTPEAPAAAGGTIAQTKQKAEVATEANSVPPPPATAAPQENSLRQHYGLAQPARVPSSSAMSTADSSLAAAAPPQTRDEAAKTEPAYKSLPQGTITSTPARGLQLKAAADAYDVQRRPAPIARVSQQFVQSQFAKKNAQLADKFSVAKPVLVSFEIQQAGNEVRIIDSDGSVYSGSFLSPQSRSYFDSSAAQKAAAAKAVQPAEAQSERKTRLYDSRAQADLSYGFRVTGTNQSLNQIVIFTGQVLALTTNGALASEPAAINGNRADAPELKPLPLLNSRISGELIIGTNKEVEVNAIPAP